MRIKSKTKRILSSDLEGIDYSRIKDERTQENPSLCQLEVQEMFIGNSSH